MPARLSSLNRNHARVELDLGDGATLTIDYRPGMLTPRQLHRAQAMDGVDFETLTQAEQADLMDDTTRMLADSLISWDLLDESDQPIAPTFAGLQDVDYAAQSVILQAIIDDQRLSKTSGNGNAPASSTAVLASLTASPETSQTSKNGISSETPLNGSE